MSKSLIPQIAKLLGVNTREQFRLSHNGVENIGLIVCIDESRILARPDNDKICAWDTLDAHIIEGMFSGEYTVKREPWKPKYDEDYWSYMGEEFEIGYGKWKNWASDLARLKTNMVFRTEEEALEARPRIYKELTGKDWSEK